MKAPRQVEMILKHGSKSSTYKFALLKALIDYVIENPTEEAYLQSRVMSRES